MRKLWKICLGLALTTPAFAATPEARSRIYKSVSGRTSGYPLLTMADGQRLLSVKQLSNMRTVYFTSRFDPQWSDLVWQDGFIRLIFDLVIPSSPQLTLRDERLIDPQQAQPATRRASAVLNNRQLPEQHRDLSLDFWIIAAVLFAAERFITYLQTRRLSNA